MTREDEAVTKAREDIKRLFSRYHDVVSGSVECHERDEKLTAILDASRAEADAMRSLLKEARPWIGKFDLLARIDALLPAPATEGRAAK
jgi:hypothetical protein